MSRLLAVLVCSYVSIAYAPSAAHAKCARMGLAPELLTPSGSTIRPGGGFVVGVTDSRDGDLDEGDASSQAAWRIRLDARAVSPHIESLAPGLSVYRVPAGVFTATLIDHKRVTLGRVRIGKRTPALPMPRIKAVGYEAGLGRRPYARLTIQLASPVPAGAVAIVVADAHGKARSWRPVKAGETSVLGYSRSRCRVLANGTVESKPNDRITVFWVDASGRPSKSSTPFKVTKTTATDDD